MVNPQVSLLNLVLEADITGDTMWFLFPYYVVTYSTGIVSVLHHDGLFLDIVDDCLDNFPTVHDDILHKEGGGFITLIRDNITLTTTDMHSAINTHNTEL